MIVGSGRPREKILEQQHFIDEMVTSEAALQQQLEREQQLRMKSDINTKAEIEALEQELINEMVASEAVLRQELERGR